VPRDCASAARAPQARIHDDDTFPIGWRRPGRRHFVDFIHAPPTACAVDDQCSSREYGGPFDVPALLCPSRSDLEQALRHGARALRRRTSIISSPPRRHHRLARLPRARRRTGESARPPVFFSFVYHASGKVPSWVMDQLLSRLAEERRPRTSRSATHSPLARASPLRSRSWWSRGTHATPYGRCRKRESRVGPTPSARSVRGRPEHVRA